MISNLVDSSTFEPIARQESIVEQNYSPNDIWEAEKDSIVSQYPPKGHDPND
jgi:hypothetical protein